MAQKGQMFLSDLKMHDFINDIANEVISVNLRKD